MRRLGLVVVNRSCFEQLSVYCLFDIQGKRSKGEIGEGRLTAEHKILRHL